MCRARSACRCCQRCRAGRGGHDLQAGRSVLGTQDRRGAGGDATPRRICRGRWRTSPIAGGRWSIAGAAASARAASPRSCSQIGWRAETRRRRLQELSPAGGGGDLRRPAAASAGADRRQYRHRQDPAAGAAGRGRGAGAGSRGRWPSIAARCSAASPGGQPAQKMFESRLAAGLAALDPGRPVFVEAEAAKIGDLVVPKGFWKGDDGGAADRDRGAAGGAGRLSWSTSLCRSGRRCRAAGRRGWRR